MATIAHWFAVYTALVTIPLLCFAAIIFHMRNRKTSTLFLGVGTVLITCGQLIQLFEPYKRISFNEFQKIMAQSGPPLGWYYGSIVFSAGLIITAISFVFIATSQRLE